MKKHVAAIVGIGETRIGHFPGRTTYDLQAEAARAAIADAGLDRSEIDGVYAQSSYLRPVVMHAIGVADYLGLAPRATANFDVGGTVAFMWMAADAIAAIEAGRIQAAVCVYGDNASTMREPGARGFTHQTLFGSEEFEDPFGSSVLASYAMVARSYLDRYRVDAVSAFGPFAVAARRHAARNDNAAYRKPVDLDAYRASRMVADPLRRLDSSPVVDGAGAFVIASRALLDGRLSHAAVPMLGLATKVTHKNVSQVPDLAALGMREAGIRALADAGVGVGDVDVLTIHDGFTSSMAITLEALGFCAPGTAGAFAADGGIDLGGEIPTNTHGGLLAQGHLGGVMNVVEAVRQLRGEAGERQVLGAEIAVVAGIGGVFSICGAMALGKEEW